jgi:ABC-type multidrug transport system fused ATPase/permease subunit
MSETGSANSRATRGARDSSSPRSGRGFGRRNDTQSGPRATFGQLLPFIFEQRGMLTFVIVLSVLGAAASLGQPVLVGQVITRVQASDPLGWLLWALVSLVIISALLNGFQHYLLQRMGEGVVLSSRRKLITRILNLPISEFDRRRTGDLVSRVGSDTTLLRAVLTQGLVEAVGGILIFVGALIAMLIIDAALFAITFGVIIIALVTVVLMSARIRPAVAKSQAKVGDLAAAVERSISSIRTIRAAGATDREVEAITSEAKDAWRLGISVAKISALIVPVAGIAMQVSFLVVIGLGGFRVATGAITIAQLVSFIIFLFMMVMPLGQAFGAVNAVNQALGALGRIQEVIDLPTESQFDENVDAESSLVSLTSAAKPDAPAVAFREVRFTYRSVPAEHEEGEITETRVLHGVNFTVERGSRTALVGPSGAGKSTILGLIERFYDPDSGVIELDGVDLRALSRTELRAQLGYVEQDAAVLAGTLRENLLLASPNADDAACDAVLRSVNLGALLDRHPDGLSAQVGEDGIMLSGGEKQRLAIARALLAAPPVLLLDESTASLDGVNERLMRDALDSVATGRTLIVIAHRLSTVVDSDKIIVLDKGTVIGEGTHAELVESTPLYRELAQHQLLVAADEH